MEDIRWPEPLSPSLFTIPEATQPRILTRKEFLATFQFSQGAIILQNMIFRYLKYMHPEFSLTPEKSRVLEDQSIRPAQAISNNAQRHALQRGEVADALREATEQARAGLGGQAEHLTRGEVVQALAERVLERDKEYLTRPNGRDYVSDPSGHYDPYKDSWRSDLCYFGFLGNTTGLADFDQMFWDVTEYWRNSKATPSIALIRRRHFLTSTRSSESSISTTLTWRLNCHAINCKPPLEPHLTAALPVRPHRP